MKRTYLDASVLIAAFQGKDAIAERAMAVLDDPERAVVVSDYLRLEVLPKPTFHERRVEIEFMQSVFDGASEHIASSPELTDRAVSLASQYDLSPIDALHVGAAAVAGVDEFVTAEKPTKPLCKIKISGIQVTSIYLVPKGDERETRLPE